MARFTILLAAMATLALAGKAPAPVSEVSYTVNEVTGCLTLAHIQALGQTFNGLNNTGDNTLPQIPTAYINDPTACIPESLFDQYFEPIVAVAKEEKLLESLFSETHSRDVAVFKRIRDCPQIRDATISRMKSLSCNSAPNPSSCRSCANFSTFNFVASCVACAAKANQESIFCCAASATTFATYYSQVCLEK
ncbi:hypothetical protein BKA59DRAFT_496893 [Fusarium tricinctum]|uniref:Uncharacterized protein n=1 Tax=Fusarium tricinctum TaxID=61284 RepID=A0A8K0W644_9HYPO|nr:hypothetical protein BKA59DRAFT_496893 [Fusarium tricinctum]